MEIEVKKEVKKEVKEEVKRYAPDNTHGCY
jgi:hypothetical protein